MARKRRNPNFKAATIGSTVDIASVATSTLKSAALTAASDEAYYAISMDVVVALRNNTAAEGPIMVGVACGDYTDAEIEEWREASTSIERGDRIAAERARRKCRIIGVFSGLGTEEVLNHGRPIRVKLRWVEPTGDQVKMWVYNLHTGTLTSGQIVLNGTIYLRYV